MRQKVTLTITLTGTECTGTTSKLQSLSRLDLCARETGILLQRLTQDLGIDLHVETHYLRQQDEDLLWETFNGGGGEGEMTVGVP